MAFGNALQKGAQFMSSPVGNLATGAIGAGMKTMQGNKAAQASQDPALMMQNNAKQGVVNDPRRMKGAPATLAYMGQHKGMGGGMGAASLANTMVDAGATLTTQQGKALSPQMKQTLGQQGAIAPSFMQNMMNPQMLMSLMQLMAGQGQDPSQGKDIGGTPEEEEEEQTQVGGY